MITGPHRTYRPRRSVVSVNAYGNPRRRLATTWLVALLASGALILRVAGLQLSPSDRLIESGEEQWFKTIPLQATRGAIVDRNGADLAISVPQTTIAADPRAVVDPVGDAARLAPILGKDQATLQQLLSSDKSFVFLARQVDDETAAAVEALELPYAWTYSEPKRFLPSGEGLGVSVIGRTDTESVGYSGVELLYEDVLKGEQGNMIVEQGAGGRTIPGGEQEVDPATAGSNVVVSLDRALQYEVEQLLIDAVDEHEAKGGTVLVTRTATNEILAAANVERPLVEPTAPQPGASTTSPPASADEQAEPVYGPARPSNNNRAVTWTYEPGSINKVITMAAVLEEGMATPETLRIVGSNVDVWDKNFAQEGRSEDETLSLRDILVHSDNVGTISWAKELGPERLDSYLRRFGLGELTGLGLKHESRGQLLALDDWDGGKDGGTSLATFSIGQGLAVTPMQMLDVFNTIANGGLAVPPRLVLGTEDPDGGFEPAATSEPQRVVSEETAAALRDMLAGVVTDGTGKKAAVDGFTVAGKTGTAWKALPGGGYGVPGRRQLVTSFVGFLPADQPELTILVVLDEPANPYSTGGSVAAPLFREVASYAAHHLRMSPDTPATTADGSTERVRATPQAPTVPSQ